MDQGPYGGYVEGYNTRSRLMDTQTPASASITSELEGDKMVLKIAKPPRDKDSIMSLSWQCCSWIVVSFVQISWWDNVYQNHSPTHLVPSKTISISNVNLKWIVIYFDGNIKYLC